MPDERVSMRQIREVLRLRFASELPQRAIAKSLGLSQGAVSGYLSRARAAGVSWPLAEDLDDVQLEALLFPAPPAVAADQRPVPDRAWAPDRRRQSANWPAWSAADKLAAPCSSTRLSCPPRYRG
jgi:transcriptional regulator with XRE-family HTH domain